MRICICFCVLKSNSHAQSFADKGTLHALGGITARVLAFLVPEALHTLPALLADLQGEHVHTDSDARQSPFMFNLVEPSCPFRVVF
jgi:hypothetical protein